MTLAFFNIRDAARAGISDEQYDREVRAQKCLLNAIEQMKAAISYVNENSALVEIEPSSFDNLVHDEFPSAEYWAEKVMTAGYH